MDLLLRVGALYILRPTATIQRAPGINSNHPQPTSNMGQKFFLVLKPFKEQLSRRRVNPPPPPTTTYNPPPPTHKPLTTYYPSKRSMPPGVLQPPVFRHRTGTATGSWIANQREPGTSSRAASMRPGPVSWQGGAHGILRLRDTPGPEPNQCIIRITLMTGQLPQINVAAIRHPFLKRPFLTGLKKYTHPPPPPPRTTLWCIGPKVEETRKCESANLLRIGML